MSNLLTNDGKYIFINSEYAEAYIPEELFDKPEEDPIATSLAYDTGESVNMIGLFYIRFFDTDSITNEYRHKYPLYTIRYPNIIETRPSGANSKEIMTFGDSPDIYRIMRYYKGDILMDATSKKSPQNVELFTKLILAGKVPSSLSYDDVYFAWEECFKINGVSSAIPATLMQAIIAKLCRNSENSMEEFRFLAGKENVNPYNFTMLSMNQASAYSSVMSSMSFERYAEKLTTSIVMSREGIEQEVSPIEKVITM